MDLLSKVRAFFANQKVQFVLRVVVSLLAMGATYAVSNQAAIVMALAIVITWCFNYLSHSLGKVPDRSVLTGALFVISLGLAVAFNPGLLPPFPVLPADGAGAMTAIITYLVIVAGSATPIVGAATLLYNMLVKDVFDQLLPRPQP